MNPVYSNPSIDSLTETIRSKTESHFYPRRMFRAIKYLGKYDEIPKAACASFLFFVEIIYLLAIPYFLMEGSARSYIEVGERNESVIGIRGLGDGGGWTSLAIITASLVIYNIHQGIRYIEYRKISSICKKWILNNQQQIRNDENLQKVLYESIQGILNASNKNTFDEENLISKRQAALEIFETCEVADKDPNYILDQRLGLPNLKLKIEKRTYLNRIWESRHEIIKQGPVFTVIGIIIGFALPIILFGCAILSIVGDVGLGMELFGKRESLAATGHFTEWVDNAVLAVTFGYIFFHKIFILNIGDYTIVQNVVAKALLKVQNDAQLYNHLCPLANEELDRRAGMLPYTKYPHEYQRRFI